MAAVQGADRGQQPDGLHGPGRGRLGGRLPRLRRTAPLVGGIFFSAERFPDAFQPLIQALPLTATNDILRAILLDGQSILDRGTEVLTLVAWGGIGFLLSLKMFRWI